MRVRTAKTLAQRIDLYYFTRAHGMRRWRLLLSVAVPAVALLWVVVLAAAGSRKPYSPGPVSSAHAFTEAKCEACHTGFSDQRNPAQNSAPDLFRAHASDRACLSCHDAPVHAANQTPPPGCAACHQEHRGRVQLVKTADSFCVDCHGDLKTSHGIPAIATRTTAFPDGHAEFVVVRPEAKGDPGHLRFNHAAHMKDTLRGPNGPEKLECATCHKPDMRKSAARAKGPQTTGLMAPIGYAQNCARCHPLFFDERIDREAPHTTPEAVRAFVVRSLTDYIRQSPGDISKPDTAFRRVPLNFPRPVEPPARSAPEWVERRALADEELLWKKTCAECHGQYSITQVNLPFYEKTSITAQWMPRASFDHTPHAMVTCASCHAAETSTTAADVLMPGQAVCATCHAPAKGAESRCFECHGYHDWTKSHPVTPRYRLSDFR
jgi:predicted CXXCH cytochrome family protein